MPRYLKASIIFLVLFSGVCFASDVEQQLNQASPAYVKYFKDNALDAASGFQGLTRGFQFYLGGQSSSDEAVINYGAPSYDQTILGRIGLVGGISTIMDTYVSYATPLKLSDAANPLINCNGSYYGAGGVDDKIQYGLYRVVRILGRDISGWWNSWDWIVDTGATACFITEAVEAYQRNLDEKYRDFANLLASYILKLQDTDGGIRYGPRGMYHSSGNTDFFWNLKSTEQNERCYYALEVLSAISGNTQHKQASTAIKNWLKTMYNKDKHLFYSAASFDGSSWVNSDIDGYITTDVMAFAPIELMFSDTSFGATQAERDAEVDAMFNAIESKTAFLDANNKPLFFRFSVSQVTDPVKGDYGTVEWSSQMALAYLRAAQVYSNRDWDKSQSYVSKFNGLITSLEAYFTAAPGDPAAKIAPYASYYLDKSIAGIVPTGTGFYTFNCRAALASAYFAFAKAGYDPTKIGGGSGIPGVLNLAEVPWYQNSAPYNSTGAAASQMIINYMRTGTGQSLITQNAVYEYAKSPNPNGAELTPDEVKKALGHFDPYDAMVSNGYDSYDSLPAGNPYQGYNFSVDTYDPALKPTAMNDYMRDICHWMAYTVTKEEWWKDGALVLHPNTPAAVPLYGRYNNWAVVKGYAVSANPCPQPHTNPWNSPEFTVYGLWIKDPLIDGIGQDTYKTAAECIATYFKPVAESGTYYGKLVQVAEPPPVMSGASIRIRSPQNERVNLMNIGVAALGASSKQLMADYSMAGLRIGKKGWQDMVDSYLKSDPNAQRAFDQAKMGSPIFVKRPDLNNAGYYLVPFNKNLNGGLKTTAVVILDANKGYFKEASWSAAGQKFLKVQKNDALRLVKEYILKDMVYKLRLLRYQYPLRLYAIKRRNLEMNYSTLLAYTASLKAGLLWQPKSALSSSAYQPYWKLDTKGYIWYVTQSGKVVPAKPLADILSEIETNRNILKNFK